MDGTDIGKERIAQMKSLEITEVHERIEMLLSQGYDKRPPTQRSEEENITCMESSLYLIRTLYHEEKMKSEILMLREASSRIHNLVLYVDDNFLPYLTSIPLKQRGKQEHFSALLHNCDDDDQIDFDDTNCAIDSEDEDRLFDELDHLIDAQERAEAFRGNAYKFMANSFQRTFLKVVELQDAFALVSTLTFSSCKQNFDVAGSTWQLKFPGLFCISTRDTNGRRTNRFKV